MIDWLEHLPFSHEIGWRMLNEFLSRKKNVKVSIIHEASPDKKVMEQNF